MLATLCYTQIHCTGGNTVRICGCERMNAWTNERTAEMSVWVHVSALGEAYALRAPSSTHASTLRSLAVRKRAATAPMDFPHLKRGWVSGARRLPSYVCLMLHSLAQRSWQHSSTSRFSRRSPQNPVCSDVLITRDSLQLTDIGEFRNPCPFEVLAL